MPGSPYTKALTKMAHAKYAVNHNGTIELMTKMAHLSMIYLYIIE